MAFRTPSGIALPAVTADQMREIDRIAVEEFGLSILQMMENAGRILAAHVISMIASGSTASAGGGAVTVIAGPGGNGGGGLCCARHLHNRGITVNVVTHRAASMGEASGRQMAILRAAGLRPIPVRRAAEVLRRASIVVDALIGYGLRGAPTGRTAELIELCNTSATRVLALDVPSGVDATTGETPGPVVRAERTLTLALPKTGLRRLSGDLYLAEIGIPPEVYRRLGLAYTPPFGAADSVVLVSDDSPA